MSGIRRSHNRQEISPRRVEALPRDEFSREIEAQRNKVPDWRNIAKMARLDRSGPPSKRCSSSTHCRRDDNRAREALSGQ